MSEYGDEPEGTFSIFFAEGEALAKQRQYKKAIESFTKVRGGNTKTLQSRTTTSFLSTKSTLESFTGIKEGA